MLAADLLGGGPLLFGQAPLLFGKLKLGAMKFVGLLAERFGLFALFDARRVSCGRNLCGNGLDQRVDLRREVRLGLFKTGFLGGQQLLGAAPLPVERSADALPSWLRFAGLRFLFVHGCRSRESTNLSDPSRGASPAAPVVSRHRQKDKGRIIPMFLYVTVADWSKTVVREIVVVTKVTTVPLNIPTHRRHRVEWTWPDEPTIWLAVCDYLPLATCSTPLFSSAV